MDRHWLWGSALLLAVTGCEPVRLAPEQQDDLNAEQAKQAAMDWLERTGALDGVDELELIRVDFDELGMAHVRLQQLQHGVPVEGAQVVVHLQPSGLVRDVTDRVRRRLDVDAIPGIDEVFAQGEALVGNRSRGRPSNSALKVVRVDDEERLAWLVQLEDLEGEVPSRPVIAIDAHTGDELFRYDNLQTVRNRRTHSANNSYSLPGTLRRAEGDPATGDAAIDAAHAHAGFTYDYYWNEQGRDSWDGAGAAVTSTAHYGNSYENAFWDGTQMVYGDGGFYFYPLSLAVDVVSHEITHAVTERTAGLIYAGQSGGLNEATSDIMGAVVESYARGWAVDSDTWKVGEDIARPALGEALRFMDDPTRDGISIGHFSDYYAGMGVHYSSGIANRAFYLMVQDPALDIRDAGDIWFRALSFYMTPSTTFAEAAQATRQAAADLFGNGSDQEEAVRSAWATVGVGTLDWNVIATEEALAGVTGTELRFQYALPAGANAIAFSLAGNNGDADLYVRRGSPPTTSSYDCASASAGSNERCEIAPASNGIYHVLVRAWSSFDNVDLIVEADAGATSPDTEICDDGIDNDGNGVVDCFDAQCSTEPACLLGGAFNSAQRFEIPTPAGASALDISISGGTGDADLYVRFDRRVRPGRYDCSPYLPGNDESCRFDPAEDGVYHVVLHGFTSFDDVALTVRPTF